MKKILIILSISIQAVAYAQLPDTDIWLLDINKNKDSIWLSNPQNITNRKGYDNQPAFSPDGKYILYTSIRDEKQSDIYKYDLATKQITQITNTATSEYSPTFMPDGKNISVVMVEPDSTQRLWKFPIQGGASSCIAENIDSVGYHCWVNKDTFAFVKITEPLSLFFYSLKSKKEYLLVEDAGRCILSMKNNKGIFYTAKNGQNFKTWQIRLSTVDYEDIAVNMELHELPESTQDFNFFIDKSNKIQLFYASNSKIISEDYHLFDYRIITDLEKSGIKNITRIAVSPDGKKMAIVATHN